MMNLISNMLNFWCWRDITSLRYYIIMAKIHLENTLLKLYCSCWMILSILAWQHMSRIPETPSPIGPMTSIASACFLPCLEFRSPRAKDPAWVRVLWKVCGVQKGAPSTRPPPNFYTALEHDMLEPVLRACSVLSPSLKSELCYGSVSLDPQGSQRVIVLGRNMDWGECILHVAKALCGEIWGQVWEKNVSGP